VVSVQASVWRFVVRPGRQPEFEELYGPGGMWAALFHESRAYRGSILLRSHAQDRAYTLIDFWDHAEDFEAFKQRYAAAYGALDHEGEGLTEAEEHVGWFDDLP
jgi:heme-degrading monooxygenase HmoA